MKIFTILLLVTLVFTIYFKLTIFSFAAIAVLISLIIVDILAANKLKKTDQTKELYPSIKTYLDAFENSGIYAKLDSNYNIINANRQFCQIMHITKEECKNTNFNYLIKSDPAEIYETVKHKQSWEGTLDFNTLDNESTYLNCSFIPIVDENEKLKEILFLATDITELTQSKTNIKNSLYIDSITKLPNRLKLFTDKKLLGTRAETTHILFNIDSFDTINNTYGNKFGDQILLHVANWLKENLLSKETKLYKLESDIYATIYYGDISESLLNNYLRSVSSKIIKEKFIHDEAEIDISMTIGASQSHSNQFKLAQIAYNEAKRGKKSYSIYDKKSNKEEEYVKNIKISKLLKNAIEDDLIIPYFQPILNVKTNEVEKYESLMRIKKNEGIIIPPNDFLPIAKQSKIYPKLSRMLIQKSVDTFQSSSSEFSVNLSYLDISNKKTTKFILDLLDKTGIGPWMIFEILESEGIGNYKEVMNFISQVKSYGAKIAIDDFGSGYSNFERLVELQVDFIKIDGSLIKNIHQNDDMKIITKTIINFAKELGIKTVAEYVHSEEILYHVKMLGVDYAQGFYIGKPMEHLPSSNHKVIL